MKFNLNEIINKNKQNLKRNKHCSLKPTRRLEDNGNVNKTATPHGFTNHEIQIWHILCVLRCCILNASRWRSVFLVCQSEIEFHYSRSTFLDVKIFENFILLFWNKNLTEKLLYSISTCDCSLNGWKLFTLFPSLKCNE